MGVISMLDEECIVPKATDTTYGQKLIESHVGKHPSIEKPKPPKGKQVGAYYRHISCSDLVPLLLQAEAHFALKHYAGLVRYNVSAWLEKNKDPLSDTLISILKSETTKNSLMTLLWQDFQTQEEAAKAAAEGKTFMFFFPELTQKIPRRRP
jgi:myosin protein heavy chain